MDYLTLFVLINNTKFPHKDKLKMSLVCKLWKKAIRKNTTFSIIYRKYGIRKCELMNFNTHIITDKIIIDGRHILNLNKFPNIHELEISSIRGVGINCKMWHITNLKISHKYREYYSTRILTMLSYFPNLTYLKCVELENKHIIDLSSLTNLKYLNLTSGGGICGLEHLSNLTCLKLRDDIPLHHNAPPIQLQHMHNLTYLNLEYNTQIYNNNADIFDNLINLKTLKLEYQGIIHPTLCSIKKLPNLEVLSFGKEDGINYLDLYTKIGDRPYSKKIDISHLTNLKNLHFDNKGMYDLLSSW